jgi:hypothetical protein
MVREGITAELGPDELAYVEGLVGDFAPTRSAVIERVVRERRNQEAGEGEPEGPQARAEFLRVRGAIRESNGPVTIGIPRLSLGHWLNSEAERLGLGAPTRPTALAPKPTAPAKWDPPGEDECRQMWGEDRAYWPSNMQARYRR